MAEQLDNTKTDDDWIRDFLDSPSDTGPSQDPVASVGKIEDIDSIVPTVEDFGSLEGVERYIEPATPQRRLSAYNEQVNQRAEGFFHEGQSYEKAQIKARKETKNSFHIDLFEQEFEDPTEFETGLVSATSRALGRRRIDISADDPEFEALTFSEQQALSQRKAADKYQRFIEEHGHGGVLAKVWAGSSEEMSEEQAKQAGIGIKRQEFFGRDLKEGVDPEVAFLDDPYVPYGIKKIPDLAERAVIKLGIENMFAPLLLEDDEREAYIRETRASIPTANFEQIINVVEDAEERGLSDEQIKDQFRFEIGGLLQIQAYDDLPSRFQMNAPSVKLFKEAIKNNRNQFNMDSELMANAVAAVDEKKSDKEIQKRLNFVALGALPDSMLKGMVPSTDDLVNEAVRAARRAILSKGEPGEAARVLEKAFGSLQFTEEKMGDEIVVVESTIGKLFRMLGVFTEGVAEADLGPLSMTPASRDFANELGIRDPDSTWLARALGNIETGNTGFTVHYTNEARKRGYERGTKEYHAYLLVGTVLDFFVPWEKFHLQAVTTPTKSVWRGGRMVKTMNVKGYRGQAFLSAVSPFWYDYVYKVAQDAEMAADAIKVRVGDDTPTLKSMKTLIEQDDLAQQAVAKGEPAPVDPVGIKIDALSYQQRRVASEVLNKMEEGMAFDDALDLVKEEYRPDLAETTAHAAEVITEHILHTEEAALFQRTKEDGGVLPFEFDIQNRRVLRAGGLNPDEVYRMVAEQGAENTSRYLQGLKVMAFVGDQQIISLRNTPEYLGVKSKLKKLVDDGELTWQEMTTLLSVMETRAMNEAAGGRSKINTPEQFFGQFKIKKSKTKKADGTAGPTQTRMTVGQLMDVEQANVAGFVSMFQKGDFIRLLDNDAEMLVDLMGKSFVSDFYKDLDKAKPAAGQVVENVGRSKKMPKNKLTRVGADYLEVLLRQQIKGSGTSSLGASKANQVVGNLASVYARMRGPAQSFISKEVIGSLDIRLRPDRFFRNSLIELNRGAGYFRGKKAKINPEFAAELKEGRKATTGRKRVFSDIDVGDTYVKQALGIKEGMTEIDAIKAFSRSVGYVIGEYMKMQESKSAIAGMDMMKIGTASFVSREKARSITRKVNSRMATVLGIEKSSLISKTNFVDPKKLKKMADPKSPSTLRLTRQQAANMKVLLRRLSLEPFIGKKIPQELMGADANLSKLSFENYKLIVDFLKDLEAGSYAKQTAYTEAIPRSLGYALLGALKSEVMSYEKVSDLVSDYIQPILDRFVLDDPLKNIRPEYRAVIETWLAKLQTINRDIMITIREVKKKDPDAAISLIYESLREQLTFAFDPDLVDILVGTPADFPYPGAKAKKGIVDILNEFTEAEIGRIKQLEKSTKDEGLDPLVFETRETAFGMDEISTENYSFSSLTPDQLKTIYGLPESPTKPVSILQDGESRIGFLTKSSTQQLLSKLVSRFNEGYYGISEQVNTALAVLERHSTESGLSAQAVKAMPEIERYELASALYTIQTQLQKNKTLVVESGTNILESLGGKTLNLPKNVDDVDKANAYKLFAQGKEGWRELYKYLPREGAEAISLERGTDYSPGVAFLEMVARMMARERLMGMYDDLIRVGMPGVDDSVYKLPKRNISLTGAVHSIDANTKFHGRVKNYMDLIFRESRDVRQEFTVDPEEAPVTLMPRQPRLEGVPYEFAAFDEPLSKTKFRGKDTDFMDMRAEIAAEEVLARFGYRTRKSAQDAYIDYTFPDGSTAFIPEAIATAIDDAIKRTAPIGQAKGGRAARALAIEKVGAPYLDELEADKPFLQQETGRKVQTTKRTMASAVTTLIDLFPVSINHIKRGVTTGFVIPNAGYYVANFVGGALQLVTGAGPIATTRMVLKHPKMVGAVVGRMWGDGTHKPFGNVLIVAKDGTIYSADQLADMAILSRLKSSLIQSETKRAMSDDVNQYMRLNENVLNKAGDTINSINDLLAETATALDNFYRVSVFVDQIVEKGATPASAAALARRVAFDYSALTDFEKNVVRHFIIFYSYMRKNADLFFDTLVTKPWNITNQLRLSRGLQQSTLSEDPEVVVNNWTKDRIGWGHSALRNQAMAGDKFTMLPMTPLMDTLNLLLDFYDGARGDEEAQRMLLTKVAPWVQAPFVVGTNFDIFYGQSLDKFNQVPPWLVEWDLAVTGGQLYELFEITEQYKSNPRSRLVEGDEHRPYYNAGNGRAWWIFRNLIQVPGAGRSMSWMTQLDRSDVGIMEGITDILRNARLSAEEYGIASERDRDFKEGDLESVRVGFTRFEELLGVGNVRTQIIPTKEYVRDKHFQNMKYEERRRKDSRSRYEEIMNKSSLPRDVFK